VGGITPDRHRAGRGGQKPNLANVIDQWAWRCRKQPNLSDIIQHWVEWWAWCNKDPVLRTPHAPDFFYWRTRHHFILRHLNETANIVGTHLR
jgi:hypothetical protein